MCTIITVRVRPSARRLSVRPPVPTNRHLLAILNFQKLSLFVAVFLGCTCTSTGRVGLKFLWFYVQEHPKAQTVVVLVLKRFRRRGNDLNSHPTDWEKPGIEPATPGFQQFGPGLCFTWSSEFQFGVRRKDRAPHWFGRFGERTGPALV